MKIKRTSETEDNHFMVGDVISFTLTDGEEVEAMAVEKTDQGTMFILVDCLKQECPWNKKDTTEGGYAASYIRKMLNTKILDRFPEEIRNRMVPIEGDLLSLPYAKEIFGDDVRFAADDPEDIRQWDCMKERRNRIAWRGCRSGELEWYWLRSVFSATCACGVTTTGNANHAGSSNAIGVRPRFLLADL